MHINTKEEILRIRIKGNMNPKELRKLTRNENYKADIERLQSHGISSLLQGLSEGDDTAGELLPN